MFLWINPRKFKKQSDVSLPVDKDYETGGLVCGGRGIIILFL